MQNAAARLHRAGKMPVRRPTGPQPAAKNPAFSMPGFPAETGMTAALEVADALQMQFDQ
jgi:hypothetical protein